MRTFALHGTPSPLLEYSCILMDIAFLLSANALTEYPQNTYFAKFLRRVDSNKIIAEFFGKIYCSLKRKMKGYQSKLLLKNTCVFSLSTDNNHISTILSWLDTYPCFLCNAMRERSQNFMMTGQDVIVNGWNFQNWILVYLYSMVLFSCNILIFTFIYFSNFVQRSILFIQKLQFFVYI